MMLNKQLWSEVQYGDYVDHIERTETNPLVRKSARYVSVEHLKTGNLKINSWIDEEMPTFLRTFRKGQILFGKRRAYQRKVAFADFDGICSPHIWALEARNGLMQQFLPYVMLTEQFYEYVNANSAGTMSPYLKWPQLSKYTFLLPPLDEQVRLVDLFQGIEQSIIRMQEQETNLKALQKALSNGLANKKPVFGNLLSEKHCQSYSFGDICDCIEKHDKTPLENDLTCFIGLENIESENFTLQGFGNIEDGTTFTKRFSKGDVLFGKRRAYLKKVAVADLDGICSSDILVFRAKTKTMLPELLPYYASSDAFVNHAVSTSAGSLSPRTKWRDLAGFELSVPDLKIQEKIVDVFHQLSESLTLIKNQKQTLKTLKQKLLNEILGG